ncbi:hypothetical protein OV079_20095 [Nannocystis pusilla]|uniref:Uncharacterized protein n=1 Tax=Nannocystis pusilla TaxID=889268 RepID=A0A9X3IWW5_9BACT|nr:hypothetical protein [Nannocystis pusilla]MCY1007812.1 hypothetical protein [Nannocystis pusilla]
MTTTTATRTRALVFVAVAAGLVLMPAYRQVFGGRSRFVRDWELFNEVGVGLVVAAFSVRDADGRETPIDRYAALGRERPTAPRWLRTMTGEAGLLRVAGELCGKLGAVDLRARASIATMRGWVPLHAGEHDLCRPLPPRPQIPGTRPRGHEDP